MLRFIAQRLLWVVISLVLISIITFIIIELPPGDFAERYALQLGYSGIHVTSADMEGIRKMYGLDRPLLERYWKWVTNIILHGNFGISFEYQKPVKELIGERLGYTVILALSALFFTYGLAIPIGIFSAVRQYSIGDYTVTILGYIGLATPNFLLALVLMYFNVKTLGGSAGGLFSLEFRDVAWSWERVIDLLKHLWIPAMVLGTAGTAWTIRVMRATLLDEMNKLYVMAARSKGMPEWRLLLKYPVRVAINPIVSTLGWEITRIIAGAPIVAIVLGLPDTGPLFIEALLGQDMYLAGTMLLIYTFLTVLGTLLSDILLAILDPRIRVGERV